MKAGISLSCLCLFFLSSSLAKAKTQISLNELLGQFDETTHPEFIALDKTKLPVNKPGMYLRKKAADKLILAYHDFKQVHPDIPFIIVSATRNYAYQNSIWEHKWQLLYSQSQNSEKTAKTILAYSSMPGTSRHHWGTDVDITQVESHYFVHDPKGKVLYKWLKKNMSRYGFCQTYNEHRSGGYNTEEWHWSYMPLAKRYLKQYRRYMKQDPMQIISHLNFTGHDKLNLVTIIKEYVFTINPNCQ